MVDIEEFVLGLNLDPDTTARIKDEFHKDPRFASLCGSDVSLEPRKYPDLIEASVFFIERIFPSKASVAGSERYEALAHGNWSQTCWMSPRCIFSPASAEDVAMALRIITSFNTPFSVRSGGHTPNPGFGNVGEDGILIELGSMKEITLSDDKKVVSVGPGNLWGDVYKALEPHGTTVLGGRIPQVGVGGLILGGGVSFFANEYGFVCDGVKNYQVVLSDSRIVNANSEENPDLFWALKGGGSNFGIVTRFDLYTRPELAKIWYEARVYAPSETDAILEAVEQFQNEGELDPKAGFAISSNLKLTLICYTYNAPVERPAAFDAFMRIPYMDLPPQFPGSTIGTHHGITQAISGAFPATPGRRDYRTLSTGVSAALYKEVYAHWKKKAAEIHAATGATMNFSIQSISKNSILVGKKYGGNCMGIPERSQQWYTSILDWGNEADDEVVRAAGVSVTDKWIEASKRLGLGSPYIHATISSRDQDPLTGYGAANLERLKMISQKYDEKQVFQWLQNNGFLLSKC